MRAVVSCSADIPLILHAVELSMSYYSINPFLFSYFFLSLFPVPLLGKPGHRESSLYKLWTKNKPRISLNPPPLA